MVDNAIRSERLYDIRASVMLSEALMLRYVIAALCCLGGLPQAGWSVPFQPIVGLPNSYVPGQPVTFDVRLPAISNLGAYNIDLVLESDADAAGSDFFFDVAATTPATTSYIFPSAANFHDATVIDSATRHRITLTDFAFSGVNVAGMNDHVAAVVFRTAPTFNSRLRVFVDAPLLILDTPDVAPTPVQGFDVIQSDISAAGAIELLPIPEPSSLLISVLAILTILIANWNACRAVAPTSDVIDVVR